MKIRELEIKNFGKLHEKKVVPAEGIHLIYGENESGKTTLHTFIRAMLFGLERGRGRAALNDTFSRYEPWENPNYYAGAMTFECGGKNFRLERNFDKYSKRAVLFCEDDGEELSVENGDLEMILMGLSASNYEDTLFVGQLHAKTSQALASELKNYATNYYVAGDSELDLAGALDRLRTKKKEVDREIRGKLQEKQKKRERIEQEASYVWRDIHVLETELEDVKDELVKRKEREQEKSKTENKGIIDELRPPKWRIHPIEILIIVAGIIAAFVLISRPWNFLLSIIIGLAGGIYIWNRLKDGKRKQKTAPEIMLEEISTEEEFASIEKLIWEQEHLEGDLKEKRVQYDNLREELEDMNELGEDFAKYDRRRAALTLAEKRLEEISRDMRGQMSSDLNRLASEIISELTDGKYTRLYVDEELHMSVVTEGRRIPMEQVSQGTLEQIYFAFRMAVSSLLHEEEYPVILDDTFVFYDEPRLKRTLKWLADHKQQVIIFTCQKREEELLRDLGIPYTKTEFISI